MLRIRTCAVALLAALLAQGAGAQLVRPRLDFSAENAPPVPDYARPEAWAALPQREDGADVTPPGAIDLQGEARVDVFFVHPTTYVVGAGWNAALDDAAVNARTDTGSLRNQASIFNAAGRVYAPRYRQAIFFAWIDHEEESLAARDLAYGDVERAFDHYLAHWREGRPFVLAGHSQGAHHALRLLEERVAGTPLADSLVAAYLLGVPMPADKLARTLPGLPLCHTAAQTGCIVSWNTVGPGVRRWRFDETWHRYPEGWEKNGSKELVCTNPFSWSVDGEAATAKGGRRAVRPGVEGELRRTDGPEQARCSEGLLVVTPEPGFAFRPRRPLGPGDYHRSDLSLFHFDLRENLARRVDAFFRREEESGG